MKGRANNNQIEKLPVPNDVFNHILSFLGPRDVAHLRLSKALQLQIGSFFHPANTHAPSFRSYWIRVFKKHFPHRLPDIFKKKDINWLEEFKEAEDTYRKVREVIAEDNPDDVMICYDKCSPKIKKLFYDIIEGDTNVVTAEFPLEDATTFNKLFEKYAKYSYVEFNRDNEFYLLQHVAKTRNQGILDHLYQIGITYFCPSDESMVDVKKRDSGRCTLLHWDVYCNRSEEEIISHIGQGYDINSKNLDEGTPLCIAARYGRTECAKALLSSGAAFDGALYKPSILAAENGHTEILRLLLAAGADITKASCRKIPLIVAVKNRHVETVKFLLAAGADITNTDSEKNPLMLAAENGYTEIVNILLAAGASADITNTDRGKTPLLMASENGHTDTVKVLLAAGADANKDYFDADADVYHMRNTPLSVAVKNGHTETVETLLAGKADITLPRNSFHPLFIAIEHGHTKILNILLAAGAESTNECCGKTPLIFAAEKGQTTCVEILLAKGADINQAPKGYTPLFMAVQYGHLNIVRLLLENNADLTATLHLNNISLVILQIRLESIMALYLDDDKKKSCKQRMKTFILNLPDKNSIHMTAADIAHIMGHDEIVELIHDFSSAKKQLLDFGVEEFYKKKSI